MGEDRNAAILGIRARTDGAEFPGKAATTSRPTREEGLFERGRIVQNTDPPARQQRSDALKSPKDGAFHPESPRLRVIFANLGARSPDRHPAASYHLRSGFVR